jgi:1,5-anhydro-D-fructose reductase (1,5-anhydro-D-mannitol-forming)
MTGKTKIGIGLLGAWQEHVHRFAKIILTSGDLKIDSMKHWQTSSYPECKIVAAWDDNLARGKALAEEVGCEFESDLGAFLANPAMDAVIICSPTAQHAEHVILAANAGKHIFIEKSPFTSLEGAYLARKAVKKSGVHFMVSSPMEKPRNRFAKKLVDDGKLGVITGMRFRLISGEGCHVTEPSGIYNKKEGGGGAMIDFGQHGVHILSWFLGKPIRTTAHFAHVMDFAKKSDTEDYAVAVYEFGNGVLGTVEAGWVAPCHEVVLDIYGTRGKVHIDEDDVRYCIGSEEWIQVPQSELPPPLLYPLRHWLESILHDRPDDRQNIDDAVLWTEMLVAAYRSAGKGEEI